MTVIVIRLGDEEDFVSGLVMSELQEGLDRAEVRKHRSEGWMSHQHGQSIDDFVHDGDGLRFQRFAGTLDL